ncbi:MAG TPA: hypothetical protein VFZ73_04955, partial [Gemmatimonadaceae bacterium]
MSERSPDGEHRTMGRVLAVAVAWAMLASAAEFIVHLVTRYALHKPVYQGLDAIWAKPLVNVVIFGMCALVLRLLPARVFIRGLAFLAAAAPLLLLLPGSPVPMIILAAGIGTQLGRLLSTHSRQDRTVQAGKVLAGVFVVAALATQGWRLASERRSAAASAPDGAPNILL